MIEQNIASCDVFVPVISANTNKRDEGIFIREWNRALERLRDMDRATARLIHPVIIDETPENAVSFSGFRDFHYTRANGGEAKPEFIKALTDIVRERRLKGRRPMNDSGRRSGRRAASLDRARFLHGRRPQFLCGPWR